MNWNISFQNLTKTYLTFSRRRFKIQLFKESQLKFNYPRLINILFRKCDKSIDNIIILIFYIRDINGLGYKELGKSLFQFLMINYPSKFIKLIPLIPIYGRWDDLLYLFPKSTNLKVLEYTRLNYCSNISKSTFKMLL